MNKYRDLRPLGKSDVASVQSVLEHRINIWSSNWLSQSPGATVAIYQDIAMLDARTDYGLCFQTNGGDYCALYILQNTVAKLTATMFACGEEEVSVGASGETLDYQIYLEGIAALAAAILGDSVERVACRKPAKDNVIGIGYSNFAITLGNATFKCSLSQDAVRGFLANTSRAYQSNGKTTMTGLRSAVQHIPVKPRAILGEAEITLGELLTLRIGDVIPLNTNLKGPNIRLDLNGTVLCRGTMGKHGAVKALILTGKRSL